MSIAVVLATYNGRKYIVEQLDSIKDQTMKPDRVYIYDDCSEDNTVEIIKKYICDNLLGNNWVLRVNQANLGWKNNFHQAIVNASEDYIFLCDQDDVWDINKIRIMSNVVANNQHINVLACSYEPLYERGTMRKISPHILSTVKDNGSIHKVHLNEKFHVVLRPGCCYLIKRDFITRIKDVWIEDVAHDMNLWTTSLLQECLYVIEKILIKWRRYDNSSSSPVRGEKHEMNYKYSFMSAEIQERMHYYDKLLDFYEKNPFLISTRGYKLLYNERRRNMELSKAFKNKSIYLMMKNYIQYHKSYLSIRSFFSAVQGVLGLR